MLSRSREALRRASLRTRRALGDGPPSDAPADDSSPAPRAEAESAPAPAAKPKPPRPRTPVRLVVDASDGSAGQLSDLLGRLHHLGDHVEVLVAPHGDCDMACAVAEGAGVPLLPVAPTRADARWSALAGTPDGHALCLLGSRAMPLGKGLAALCRAVDRAPAALWLTEAPAWLDVDGVGEPGDEDTDEGDETDESTEDGEPALTLSDRPGLAGVAGVPMLLAPPLVAELAASGHDPRVSVALAALCSSAVAAHGVRLAPRPVLARSDVLASVAAATPTGGGAVRRGLAPDQLAVERALLADAPEARAHWAAGRLRTDLLGLLGRVDAPDEEWQGLRAAVVSLVEDAGALLGEAPSLVQAFARLVADDDRAGAATLLEWSWRHSQGTAPVLREGRLVADLPAGGEAVLTLPERDTRARAVRLHREPDADGEVDGAIVEVVVCDRTPRDADGPVLLGVDIPGRAVEPRRVDEPVLAALNEGPLPGMRGTVWALPLRDRQLRLMQAGEARARVRTADGSERVVPIEVAGGPSSWRWRMPGRRRSGEAALATSVDLGPGPTLTVTGRWLADERPEEVALVATQDEVVLSAPLRWTGEDWFTVDLVLRAAQWGRPERPAPSGRYTLALVGPGLDDAGLAVEDGEDPGVGAQVPGDLAGHEVRVRLGEGARGRLTLALATPLADDEVGPQAQQALQESHAQRRQGPRDPQMVFFQSYQGRWATDSPRALHEEIRRRRPDLRLVWSVEDHAVDLPEGAEPVVNGSRAWYDAWASAAYVCTNTPPAAWFAPAEGQSVLQTFHGYFAKTMGLARWRARGVSERRQQHLIGIYRDRWTVILTPCPEMDRYYCGEYAYDGPVISQGLPRNDDLVGERLARLRQRSREQLGIGPGQRAVLYAPTWRDELTTRARRAHMHTHLDVHELAERLGEDWVVLLRGHRFHAEGRRPEGGSRVLDVTHHPEINDLVAASDAAVLDYSSLRWETALARVPTVFLVPDLEDYSGPGRGFLFPFEPTAPGPFAESTAEVASLLADLEGLRTSTAGQVEQMNATYNYLQDGRVAERVVQAWLG